MKRFVKSSLIITMLIPLVVFPVAVVNPVKIFGTMYVVATYINIGLIEGAIAYINLALLVRRGLGL